MWLVLAQDGDVEATWLAERLRTRTEQPVHLIEAGALVHDAVWDHRVGAEGVRTRLVVEGTPVDSVDVTGVVNRLGWLTTAGFHGATAKDREYAAAELYALGLSWLAALGGRVINRPASIGLSGTYRSPGQWRLLARTAGLPIVPYSSTDLHNAGEQRDDLRPLVLDGEILDADGLAPTVRAGLVELQRRSGLDLLEARLTAGGDALRTVSYLPGLRRLGEPVVDAVYAALIRRGPGRWPDAPVRQPTGARRVAVTA